MVCIIRIWLVIVMVLFILCVISSMLGWCSVISLWISICILMWVSVFSVVKGLFSSKSFGFLIRVCVKVICCVCLFERLCG